MTSWFCIQFSGRIGQLMIRVGISLTTKVVRNIATGSSSPSLPCSAPQTKSVVHFSDWLVRLLSWCLLCRRVSPTNAATNAADFRVVYCNGFHFAYSQHATFSTYVIHYIFETTTYLSRAQYSLFYAEIAVESQSVGQSFTLFRAGILSSWLSHGNYLRN